MSQYDMILSYLAPTAEPAECCYKTEKQTKTLHTPMRTDAHDGPEVGGH